MGLRNRRSIGYNIIMITSLCSFSYVYQTVSYQALIIKVVDLWPSKYAFYIQNVGCLSGSKTSLKKKDGVVD